MVALKKKKAKKEPNGLGLSMLIWPLLIASLAFVVVQIMKPPALPPTLLELFDVWNENMKIEHSKDMGLGIYANKPIKKGDILAKISGENTISMNSAEQICPGILAAVQDAGSNIKGFSAPFNQVVLTILLASEKGKGNQSHWVNYIDKMPVNVSTVSWYWTKEEASCAYYNSNEDDEMTKNFVNIFKAVAPVLPCLKNTFPSPISQSDIDEALWSFLMVMTRSYGTTLVPLDLFNHNPKLGLGPMTIKTSEGKERVYLVATRDHQPGEQIFASYGSLSPYKMLRQYGFIDESVAVVADLPSLTKMFQESEYLKGVPCEANFFARNYDNEDPKKAYVVQSRLKIPHEKPYKTERVYRPGMPDLNTLECLQVMSQKENQKVLANFVAKILKDDIEHYRALATRPECLQEVGNFPNIRKANEISAKILENALHVASRVNEGTDSWPSLAMLSSNKDVLK
eukprot:m.72789 g.72789  ORF g.72789 m.72789 type:complete len:457 (+) comp12358_c0_seq2:279-1649(+)